MEESGTQAMSMSHRPQQQSMLSSKRFSYWQAKAPGREQGCPAEGGVREGQTDPGEEGRALI